MNKSFLTSVLGLFILCFACIALWAWQSRNKQAEHIENTVRSLDMVLGGFGYIETSQLGAQSTESAKNSWRARHVVLVPSLGVDWPPGMDLPWQSEAWREWDEGYHPMFCLQRLDHLPREERNARLMTLLGKGSPFEFMKREGLKELQRIAPNAILLVEVINSSVPWLSPGDLELDKMPRRINDPDRLGIGSVHGYDEFVVGFADQSIWIINASIPFSELEKFLTVEQAMLHSREVVLGPYGSEFDLESIYSSYLSRKPNP